VAAAVALAGTDGAVADPPGTDDAGPDGVGADDAGADGEGTADAGPGGGASDNSGSTEPDPHAAAAASSRTRPVERAAAATRGVIGSLLQGVSVVTESGHGLPMQVA
jgi:hypothetical protein